MDQDKLNQKYKFEETLKEFKTTYNLLVEIRYSNEDMARYDYMLYDFYDMIIHLENFTRAYYVKSHPSYLKEKIKRVKDYVDNIYNYVESLEEENND